LGAQEDESGSIRTSVQRSGSCEAVATGEFFGGAGITCGGDKRGDTLVVWKLDRLARSMKQLIETVEKLRVRGIGLRSLREALDTTTAQGLLVFHMFSALAEFERSLIRERTRAGLAAARRIGRTGGRPPKLNDDDLEAARALLANPDIGVTQIADRLGVSPATLYRYIPAGRTANAPDG
jgi:DNA invertase Pin-like site-specific DNA recombinase